MLELGAAERRLVHSLLCCVVCHPSMEMWHSDCCKSLILCSQPCPGKLIYRVYGKNNWFFKIMDVVVVVQVWHLLATPSLS